MPSALLLVLTLQTSSFLIVGGTILDGSGGKPFRADLRIQSGHIAAIGALQTRPGEVVVYARGKYVTPGFIDAHSHADGALDKLESQIRQGITTAVVGQDGGRSVSVADAMRRADHQMINFAFFSGHGGLRQAAMAKSAERTASAEEIERMKVLLDQDMRAGALGLSSGLEYNPGFYASHDELIQLSKVAARYGGMYISHVRDETNGVFDSFAELIDIAKQAHLPAQISHIKMGVAGVWNKAPKAVEMVERARREGLDITADVYPYTYWQSTIRVLTNSRDWTNRQVWVDALKDVGGPKHVRITSYSPDPHWQGRTLKDMSVGMRMDPADLIMYIIEKTKAPGERESVMVEAMIEPDLVTFLKQPWMMICSDGSGGGRHPRGAGSFPRILARYVREQHVLTWPDAIRKMTSLPANRFKLLGRGLLSKGAIADVLVLDPAKIRDLSTPEKPTAMAVGVEDAFVNGKPVLLNDSIRENHAGESLRRGYRASGNG